LDAGLTARIETLARSHGATLYMSLLGAFQVLLARHSGQEDILVGSPIANRTQTETEGLIGLFVNTLVLRTRIDPEISFSALLAAVRGTALQAYAHQDLPFEQLIEALNPERSLSHSPLFQAMFVLQNAPMSALDLPGLTLTPLEQPFPVAKFDLTLSVAVRDGALHCHWEYATDLFEAATVERLAERYRILLEAVIEAPELPLGALSLLTETERGQLQAWNATEVAYPQDRTVVDLFERQVAKTPENTALVFADEALTYAGLNARANRLAHFLIARGVGPDTLVGLCVERSVEMVVALLGILKAGGAYVPLDPGYPEARLAFVLEDSGVALLLTQAALSGRLPEHGAELLCLDADWARIAEYSEPNPQRRSGPE
ncbi:MAG: AMP-binding protein, partial [bacterium]|nr:AMP-binding protein [bacterium]